MLRRDRPVKGWRENYVHISTRGGVKIALFGTSHCQRFREKLLLSMLLFLIDFVAPEIDKLLTGGTNSPAEKFLPILQGSLQPQPWPWPDSDLPGLLYKNTNQQV